MKRKTLTNLLLAGFMLAPTTLQAHAATNEGWVKKGDTWQYLKQGNTSKGWVLDNGSWYYLGQDGNMKTGWAKVGNTWYYLNQNGAMKTGWLKEGNVWYLLDNSGAMKTGWAKVGNTWYYLNQSGAMKTGWLKEGSTWYFLEGSGAMKTGWVKDNNVWYLLGESGAMKTGWAKVGNTWYYLNQSGAMKTGWLAVGGAWYYLDGSGAMKTGWIQDGDKWYYLENNGAWNPNRKHEDTTTPPSDGGTINNGDTTNNENLQALPGYTLPSGNYVYPMNMDKLNTVSMTNTWDLTTKMNELQDLAVTLGVPTYKNGSHGIMSLVKIKTDASVESTLIYLELKNNKMILSYQGMTNIRQEESKKVIESILKPYFPTSYKNLTDKYFNEHYVGGGNSMDTSELHDGLNVEMYAGDITFWK